MPRPIKKQKTTTTTNTTSRKSTSSITPAIQTKTHPTTSDNPKITKPCNDLFSYLEIQPRNVILGLYADQTRGLYAAKTVLQKLPEMARQFVIRLAVCGGSFPLEEMKSWIADRARNKHDHGKKTLARMEALCVIEPILSTLSTLSPHNSNSNGNGNSNNNEIQQQQQGEEKKETSTAIVKLTHEFHGAIRASLTSLSSSPYPEVPPTELERMRRDHPKTVPTFDQLENFTQNRWDSVLHFLVGDKSHEDPPGAVITFIKETGLMKEESPEVGPEITSKGYEFMLHEVHVQVWQFVMQYLTEIKEKKPKWYNEAMLLLICLSYCRVGTAYPVAPLSKNSQRLMRHWVLLGLVYVCKVGEVELFYPTRAVVNLVVGSLSSDTNHNNGNGSTDNKNSDQVAATAALATSAAATRALELALEAPKPSNSHIAIIVQTNFQVCAYTTSTVHVSMLGLFCDPRNFRRLPNVIFFQITREAVKRAFKLGIQAKQIIKFLKMHAHPRLRTGDQPLIPTNVEDQIILWDRERRRVQFQEIYKEQCHNLEEYDDCRKFAKDNGFFAWGSRDSKEIMVNFENAGIFIAFVRKWRMENQGL